MVSVDTRPPQSPENWQTTIVKSLKLGDGRVKFSRRDE